MAAALAVAVLFASAPAHAVWQNFSAADGLADNQVLAIEEAADGALSFGTPQGVSRYDGARWSTLVDSLPNRRVQALLEDRRGEWWYGTQSGGLARYDGSRWRYYGPADGTLPSAQVQAILEDARGDLWFGTFGGLVRYEPAADRWTTYGAGTLVNPFAWRLLEDRAGNLWVGTPAGASRLDPSRTVWTSFPEDPQALGRDSVLALGLDAAGAVWFGTDRGAWRYDGAAWSSFKAADGLPGDSVTAFALDRSGALWIGGYRGLSRFDGRAFRPQPATLEGLSLGLVRSMAVDSSGNLWVGTLDNGLFRHDGVAFRHFYSTAGECPFTPSPSVPRLPVLDSNCLTAMQQDRVGDTWFATYGGGASRLGRDGAWSTLRRAAGVPLSDTLTALTEDGAGRLWFGSIGYGVAVLDAARTGWTLHRRATGLVDDRVVTLHTDTQGVPWVGTESGAGRWTGSAWQNWLVGGDVVVSAIAGDPQGNVWLSTSAGLHRIDPTRTTITRLGTADGVIEDAGTALLVTRAGEVWWGTPSGLSRLAGGTWTSLPTFGSAGASSVLGLGEDLEGRVWVASDFSVVVFDGGSPRTFTALDLGASPTSPTAAIHADAGGSVWVTTFGGLARWNGESWRLLDSRGSGLATDQVTGILEDSQGDLWFASNAGLTQHQPDRVAPQTVFVTRPAPLTTVRDVSFVFGAAYGEAADLEFSHSWDGGAFTPWSPDNTFTLPAVADGLHTFEVRAREWTRNADATPARFTFELDGTPPTAVIATPVFGAPVRGEVTLVGTAADRRFRDFMIEARPAGTVGWTGPDAVRIAAGTTPVSNGALGQWSTAGLADGEWDVRLSVTDTLGLYGIALLRVIVDNVAPFADVTSPARVSAAAGGPVFTTGAEARAYFPPGAFDRDAVVTIEPATPAAPDTLPDGATRAAGGWRLGWGAAVLEKDGVLELAPSAGGGALAAYALEGGVWRRLGGTTGADGRVSIPLRAGGTYALYRGGVAVEAGTGLGELSFAPRVFSPRGNFADASLAIGFSMGRAGSATVKVYNRSGRLVRAVAEGLALPPGEQLVRWDGRDADGGVVEPGLYIVAVEALGTTRSKPVAVVR
jgi:ligand-binding sensor domain-containing protein